MSLQSIAEFNPNYDRENPIEDDLIGRKVFTAQNEEVGLVDDLLVDESGHFRYLIVNASSWLPDRKFLLPIGKCRAYQDANSLVLTDISDKQLLEQIPAYESDRPIHYEYEENVRKVYRQFSAADDSEIPSYDRDSYSYDREPELYQLSAEDNQTIKLYEERLITNKERHQAGEVTIGKRVETETAEVEIPVQKEKVVVKRKEVSGKNIEVDPGEATFEEGAVAKVKVYEETASIEKKAFVREEVEVKKEVETEVINASETLRKETLEMMSGEENIEIEK